jgi:hypothetical protein
LAHPLFGNADQLICANLEQFRPDIKVRVQGVIIGELTDIQLTDLNSDRAELNLPPLISEVIFFGWHTYKSRIIGQRYTIDDVIDQIRGALASESIIIESRYMTALENPNLREDRFGNQVNDKAILECSARHPRPELFSVMPKGDIVKPPKN